MEKPDQYLYKIFLSFRKIFVWSHKTFPLKGPALEIFLFLLLVLIQQFTNVWKKSEGNWDFTHATHSKVFSGPYFHTFGPFERSDILSKKSFKNSSKNLSNPVAFVVSIALRISKTLSSVAKVKYSLSGRSRLSMIITAIIQ